MTDLQIAYDYLAFPDPERGAYDTTCANTGFIMKQSSPPGSVAERSHVDTYLYAPAINRTPTSPWYEPDLSIPTGCYDTAPPDWPYGCGKNYGVRTSPFTSPEEDLSTGGPVFHANSIALPGPIPSMVGVTGPNAWTRQSSGWSGAWAHEFQHGFNRVLPNSIMSEIFSSAAQAIVGENGDGRIEFDVPYTSPIFGWNYEGWRGFTAYLVYNFRGADTTFAGRSDDLVWRWAHGNDQGVNGLVARLADAECAECQAKTYLAGRTAHDRMQIIMQNWRVANYVNKSSLAEGQYGFPPQFEFIPSRDVGNWRDVNPHPLSQNALVIPPEVMLNKGQATRESLFVGMRYTPASAGGMDSTEMSFAAFGSEYWVVKAGPDVRDADRALVARITPRGVAVCNDAFDGRLLATLVAYNAPADSLAALNNLYRHPEWVTGVQGPVEMDVDSIRGHIELVLPNFGQTCNAVVVVMSLGEANVGVLSSYTGPSTGVRILPYSISFGFRASPFLATNPVEIIARSDTTDRMPAWNPAGDEVVFVRQAQGSPYNQIWRKKTDGSPAQPLFSMSATSRVYFVDWSPRGDWVAYDYSPDLNSSWDIWAYNIQTQENRRLTTYYNVDCYPSFSPNGQVLVYWRYLGGSSWQVRKVNLNGTGDALLASPSLGPGGPARWSPDGLTIYLFPGTTVSSIPATGGTPVARPEFGAVYSADLNPGTGKPLVEERGNIPNCGPGTSTAYSRLGVRDLTALKTDLRMFRTTRRTHAPRYARNGTHVAFGWTAAPDAASDQDLFFGTVTYNHAPVFTGVSGYDQTIESCVLFVRNLSAADPDGEPITYKISQAPPGLVLYGGTQLRWTPDNSQLGDHYVALRACDPSGGADWKVIKLTVEDFGWCEFECPPNHPDCYPARAEPKDDATIPTAFALDQNRPNPFRDGTAFRLAIPRPTEVALDILDVQGRLVRKVVNGPMSPGYYTINWDRRDSRGNHVGPGIYFYRMRGGDFVARRKMVLLP
jgi:hypothetical protein